MSTRTSKPSVIPTILTGGRPGAGRVGLWLKNLLVSSILHPIRTFRIMQPFGWARESVILLCMQALEGHIDMCWERSLFSPVRKTLVSRGERIPTFIPQANQFAEHFARMAGGTAMSM